MGVVAMAAPALFNLPPQRLASHHSRAPKFTCLPMVSSPNAKAGVLAIGSPRTAVTRRMAAVTESTKGVDVDSKEQQLMKDMVGFLEQDLPHLFDEQGIDRARYEERVDFRDPITKYDTLSGYLFNIQLLRFIFGPDFILHKAKQTGPNEITTRWTMRMNFRLLPWKPEVVFTGTSVMGVNLETGKFCSHVDYWDSIKNNEYFSFEGVKDILKQLRIYKTPDLGTPKFKILKRAASYEVREYEPFIVVESRTEGLAGSKGFNNVAGYVFGKNQREEKLKMTTPVFNEKSEDSERIQIVLPSKYELSQLPAPASDDLELRQVTRKYAAVTKFSGKPSEELAKQKERDLRRDILKDNLKPLGGFLLARYNDPDRTPSFLMRNEILIWLEEFSLEV